MHHSIQIIQPLFLPVRCLSLANKPRPSIRILVVAALCPENMTFAHHSLTIVVPHALL